MVIIAEEGREVKSDLEALAEMLDALALEWIEDDLPESFAEELFGMSSRVRTVDRVIYGKGETNANG